MKNPYFFLIPPARAPPLTEETVSKMWLILISGDPRRTRLMMTESRLGQWQ